MHATVEKFLRPEAISKGVLAVKILSCLLVLVLLVLIAIEIISFTISSSLEQLSPGTATNSSVSIPTLAGQSDKDYTKIASINIFGQVEEKEPVKEVEGAPQTKLDFKLVGTFISSGSDPYAIVQEKKEQDAFLIGDTLFSKAKLVQIYNDRVEIDHNGNRESLFLEDLPTGRSSGDSSGGDEDSFTVDEDELDAALDNLPLLLQQARAVPYFKDGKAIGLRLFAIRKDSIFEKVGLKNGDILKEINGNSLADPSQALKLFEQLKDDREVNVKLERNKKARSFNYQIK